MLGSMLTQAADIVSEETGGLSRWRRILELLKETFSQWSEDKAPRLGAALAYYTVVSLAPLLIIVIAIVGLVFGGQAAQGEIIEQIRGLIGDNGAEAARMLIQNAQKPASGVVATLAGVATLLFGASGLFAELQDALNTVWGVSKPGGFHFFRMVKERFFLFAVILGTGFLLLVSLVVSAWISALGKYLSGLLPMSEYVLQLVNFAVSFAVITVLFAMIYRVLPDTAIAWSDVWIGAAVTSLLFTIGKSLIGLYLGRSSVTSVYGAAGSLIVILIWVYYSAQVFFIGAEFTQVYACRCGSRREGAFRRAA